MYDCTVKRKAQSPNYISLFIIHACYYGTIVCVIVLYMNTTPSLREKNGARGVVVCACVRFCFAGFGGRLIGMLMMASLVACRNR